MDKKSFLVFFVMFLALTFGVSAQSSLLTGLTSHLAFDNNFIDSTGNYDATSSGGMITTTSGCKVGTGCANFDGINDYVNWGSVPLGTSTGTVNCWVYSSSPTAPRVPIFFRANIPFANALQMVWDSFAPDQYILYVGNGVSHTQLLGTDSGKFPTAQWTMVTLTFDNALDQFKLYVNDNINQSWVTSQAMAENTANPLTLGARTDGGVGYLQGKMDECGIWNRVLGSGEIDTLWNSGVGITYPFTSDLISTTFVNNSEYQLVLDPNINIDVTFQSATLEKTNVTIKDSVGAVIENYPASPATTTYTENIVSNTSELGLGNFTLELYAKDSGDEKTLLYNFEIIACPENWEARYTNCAGGSQDIFYVDTNECGTTIDKPANSSQSCDYTLIYSDNFDDSVIDAVIWSNNNGCVETGGRLQCYGEDTFVSTGSLQTLGLNTSQPYNLSFNYFTNIGTECAALLDAFPVLGSATLPSSCRDFDARFANRHGMYDVGSLFYVSMTPHSGININHPENQGSLFEIVYDGTNYMLFDNGTMIRNTTNQTTAKMDYFGLGDWETENSGQFYAIDNLRFLQVGQGSIPCLEEWVQSTTACNNGVQKMVYTDLNACGTFDDFPATGNGTVVACTYGVCGQSSITTKGKIKDKGKQKDDDEDDEDGKNQKWVYKNNCIQMEIRKTKYNPNIDILDLRTGKKFSLMLFGLLETNDMIVNGTNQSRFTPFASMSLKSNISDSHVVYENSMFRLGYIINDTKFKTELKIKNYPYFYNSSNLWVEVKYKKGAGDYIQYTNPIVDGIEKAVVVENKIVGEETFSLEKVYRGLSISVDPIFGCQEDWVAQYTLCNASNQQILTWVDANNCDTFDNLPAGNNSVSSCNYCSASWSSATTECQDNFRKITYATTLDNNASCCNVTGFAEDCDRPANTTQTCAGLHSAGDVASVGIDGLVEVGISLINYVPVIVVVGGIVVVGLVLL